MSWEAVPCSRCTLPSPPNPLALLLLLALDTETSAPSVSPTSVEPCEYVGMKEEGGREGGRGRNEIVGDDVFFGWGAVYPQTINNCITATADEFTTIEGGWRLETEGTRVTNMSSYFVDISHLSREDARC